MTVSPGIGFSGDIFFLLARYSALKEQIKLVNMTCNFTSGGNNKESLQPGYII